MGYASSCRLGECSSRSLASREKEYMEGADRSMWSPVNPQREQLPIGETVPEDQFRPQLGEPHHYAYVVDDIEATVNRLVDQLGAGPFFLVENVPLENVLSRGQPAEFAHNSAFGSCGDGVIELIEAVSLAPERVEKGFSGPR